MKFGIVGRINEGFFRYQGWPTVCKDENGTLYVTASGFRLTHICPFGKNVMYVSHDEGETWEGPTVINDTELDDRDAGILSLGNGKLLLSYFCHPWEFYKQDYVYKRAEKELSAMGMALFDGMMKAYEHMPSECDRAGSFVRLSRDSGKTWEAPIAVPVSSPHGPIRLSDGRLFYVGREMHTGDERYTKFGLYAFESRDDGQSWQKLSAIDLPEGFETRNFCEPHATELPDGKILVAIRAEGKMLNPSFTVYICVSMNGGKVWSLPRPTDFAGSPPHLLTHSSGAVILTYGRRVAPYGQRARISYDSGRSFSEEIVISEESASPDIGYPSTVELSDGSLLTAYYQRYQDDDFTSVLYTKWKLSDGKPV